MEFLRENLAADYADILGFVELAVEELLVNVATYAYAGTCPQEGDRSAHWGQMELQSGEHGQRALSLRLDTGLGHVF